MESRRYTQGEIRACRIFVVMLFAIGVFMAIAGFSNLDKWPAKQPVSSEIPEKGVKKRGKSPYINPPLGLFVGSAAFLALSVAAGLGVRKVVKNNLRDVELDPVSAAASPDAPAPTDKSAAATPGESDAGGTE